MYGALLLLFYKYYFCDIWINWLKTLNNLFPKFDQSKGKSRIYLESMLQIGSIAIITYAFRLLVGYLTHKIFKTDKYGPADKFAVLVAAPTIFLLQSDLKDKLSFFFLNVTIIKIDFKQSLL